MTSLNGTIFDPDTGDRLHIELAKSTSRRPRGGGDVYRIIDKRANKTEGNADHENFGDEGGEEAWEEDEDDGHDDNVINQCTSSRMGLPQMMDETSLQVIYHLVLHSLLQIWDVHAQRTN